MRFIFLPLACIFLLSGCGAIGVDNRKDSGPHPVMIAGGPSAHHERV